MIFLKFFLKQLEHRCRFQITSCQAIMGEVEKYLDDGMEQTETTS